MSQTPISNRAQPLTVPNPNTLHANDHVPDKDEATLAELGYKQEFRRELGLASTFCVSFSILGLLPSVASTVGFNLGYAGTAGSVWGWLVAGIMIQFVALAMAELCSSMPTAGGLYYASAVLAPEGWGPMCAWFTGWSNFLGLMTGPCSINYALASMIVTAVEIAHPDYIIRTWHVYLVMLTLLIVEGCLATQSTKFIARLNTVGTAINIIVVLIFIIWMPVGSINTPKTNPSSLVWTSEGIVNGTEWPTGFAFLMAFLSVIWTMAGFDASFHLSEECSNSNIASPKAIVMTAQLGLYLGWAVILVIAYTVKDVGDVVAGQYGQPMGSLAVQVLGTKSGLVMFCFTIVAQFFVGQGATVASSRVVFAYSRDGALPFSKYLSRVNSRTRTPVNAVWFVLVLGALLALLMFASPIAIGAVFSMGAIAQYVAFVFPVALKLFSSRGKFRPGPWNLGIYSTPVGILACSFVFLMIPVLCFPAARGKDLNRDTMNYTCLIYGGSMGLAGTWYAVDTRRWFKGPRINVQHLINGEHEVKAGDMMGEKKLE